MSIEKTEVQRLLERSHRLGSDPRITNFAGGNTSVKVASTDRVTGDPLEILYVKGSGGDLGTLTEGGLAILDVERLRRLKDVYRGEAHEDEMFDLMSHCCLATSRATPSIDTAMHALLPARHVDHLHPDAVIALACAEDGESLIKECYGTDAAWIPWRRPGFELGLQIEALYRDRPGLRGVVLGGHGLTAWGDTAAEAEQASLELIARAEAFIADRGRAEPFGAPVEDHSPLPKERRRQLAAELGAVIRGLASTDRRMVGHFRDDDVILDFLAGEAASRLAPLGTSCPDHFLRTKIRPLLLDMATTAPREDLIERLQQLHEEYRAEYQAYYERHATPSSPPMRGADPAIFLVPGVGMFSFGADAQTARVAGEFYVNAINVMRGAEALSRYAPIDESEKFRVEYWSLEERKLALRPPAPPLTGRVALVTGAGSGIGRATAHRLAGEGAAVVVADINRDAASTVADEIGGRDRGVAVTVDVTDDRQVTEALAEAVRTYGGVDLIVNNAGLSISKPLLETDPADWDRQHAVMARGSFLVSRAAARVMIDQGMGGDIVYVVSKNGVFAGPNNVAYSAAKADQAHQVRLLATELGEHAIRVNGVNPDGVVKGSGIFANGWGAQRAEVYGVPEENLGKFYATRTLLKQEVLPEHVANAVYVLVCGELAHTTGALIPVDGGIPVAFLR